MGHLTSGELVDLAEGSRDDRTMPHLAACDVCRRQLADLRAMVSGRDLSAAGDVPEPSPLFWDHLSARVRDEVRNESLPGRASVPLFWPRVAVAAGAFVLVVAIVAGLGSRLVAPVKPTAVAPLPPGRTIETIQNVEVAPPGSPDDPTLSLVADYVITLDWDDVREQMADSAHTGGMDASVGELDADERQELHRLLKEALARPPARTDRS